MGEASGAKPSSTSFVLHSDSIENPYDGEDGSLITAASVSKVEFRSLAKDASSDGSYISFRHQDVGFVGPDSTTQELPSNSKISLAGLDATLPMAFDNERFFDEDEGYQILLTEAAEKMNELVRTNNAWREGDKEYGLLGSMWRWCVRVLMSMTNDQINRLNLTRNLQDFVGFRTSYESFVLGGVVRAYDLEERTFDSYNLELAFKNRNASRIIVRNVSGRWDWIWHLYTQIRWGRFLGRSFPATENFPSSIIFTWAIVRRLLGLTWLRYFWMKLNGRDSTFYGEDVAQNLGAESNGYERENRAQYGTYFGREKTNAFRFEHRLATDEAIVRTFMTAPGSTMVNNGVEHVLRCLAKHWRNMLYQENGNFAHQRMEQLSPFEILRFQMPIVLSTLSNLRGRNTWDAEVLAPFMGILQDLNPSQVQKRRGDAEEGDDKEIHGPCLAAQGLVEQLKRKIVPTVCAGITAREQPFQQWLSAISDSFHELSMEAEAVSGFVSSVDIGIKLGYQLLKLVNWSVPTIPRIKDAVLRHLQGLDDYSSDLPRLTIISALEKLASKDLRTLKELVSQEMHQVRAAQLLIGRASTLVVRELRREALDERIRLLSKGQQIEEDELVKNHWYWVDSKEVKMFTARSRDKKVLKFVDVDTNYASRHETGSAQFLRYIPIAEAISRAQKAFMTIELDYCKKFTLNSFMEFGSSLSGSSLRTRLRRLSTLAQLHCSELDKARLNVLTEMKLSVKSSRKSRLSASRMVPECKPQNVLVLGGGPTGLLNAIHCLQNVLLTGGEVKLYEGRDAFDQEASSFERAQIVRLDARQVSMLRYHLGTGFEDVFIPATGETDPHLGNLLPIQGFVEVTIKRLESMLLDELINLRSKDLLHFYADSIIKYDITSRVFEKNGRSLKVGDVVFDANRMLEVEEFVYSSSLDHTELVVGNDYDFVRPREKVVHSYRLIMRDQDYDWYHFEALEDEVNDFVGSSKRLPPLYPRGKGRNDPSHILVKVNGTKRQSLDFDIVAEKFYRLDVSKSHVIIALGKPAGSSYHFEVTTNEPYAVCCIEGIKISMGMHNLGETRFGSGVVDDYRTHLDQNTRIIGDFTKSVAIIPIVRKMHEKLFTDAAWKEHFNKLGSSVRETSTEESLYNVLLTEIGHLMNVSFHRESLQCRYFELGNNYYLGMELPREFNTFKEKIVSQVAEDMRKAFQRNLLNQVDKLWFEATIEVMSYANVYNPGGRRKIPRLYTIDSPIEQRLGELKENDAFRLMRNTYKVIMHEGNLSTNVERNDDDGLALSLPMNTHVFDLSTQGQHLLSQLDADNLFEPLDTFEVIEKRRGSSLVRTSGGYVGTMSHEVPVGRVSDLARAPNGYSESRVALASFPVAHFVSHRTLWINRVEGRMGEDGFITAFVGDAQASPHFMRYSGLTGACINCMAFNNLVAQALKGTSFEERSLRYSFETSWSNGEVVKRGTGSNYGEDGFLRPGFPYRKLVNYLFDRAIEHQEIGDNVHPILSRDWKERIAAAFVPRGLETEFLFYESLIAQLETTIRGKFEDEVLKVFGSDKLSSAEEVSLGTAVSYEMAKLTRQWKPSNFAPTEYSELNEAQRRAVMEKSAIIKVVIDALLSTLHYAIELRLANRRISSELFNQPKPVDSIIDDCTVEAQAYFNRFTGCIAMAAATLGLRLASNRAANIVSGLVGVWNIVACVGILTRVSRYRNRNEEMRRVIADQKMQSVVKRVFSLIPPEQRDSFPAEQNPFVAGLERLVHKFIEDCHYYNADVVMVEHFHDVCTQFLDSIRKNGRKGHQAAIVQLMRQLTQQFIPVTFHTNSYLQEDLVDLYKALDEMLILSNQARIPGSDGAQELSKMLLTFEPQLQASIERGEVKEGGVKDRTWRQREVSTAVRHILGPFLRGRTITSRTLLVLQKTEALQEQSEGHGKLDHSVRDLKDLYFATLESERCCVIFVSATVIFWFSIFFSLFRLVEFAKPRDTEGYSELQWVLTVLNIAAWVSLAALPGAFSVACHFVRKLTYLNRTGRVFGRMESDPRVSRMRAVAWSQQLVAVVRLMSIIAASAALPLSAAVSTLGSSINVSENVPLYIATASFCGVIFAFIWCFMIDSIISYSLDPFVGHVICEPFRNQIEDIKLSFSGSTFGDIETTQKLDKEAREYAAREFLQRNRFDTVFEADRFGSILQYLQCNTENQT